MEIYAFMNGDSVHQKILSEYIRDSEGKVKFITLQVIFRPNETRELKEDDYSSYQKIELNKDYISTKEHERKVTILRKEGGSYDKESDLYKIEIEEENALYYLIEKRGDEDPKVWERDGSGAGSIRDLRDLRTFRDRVREDDYEILNNTITRAPNCPPQTGG